MRTIGVHVRVTSSLLDTLQLSHALGLRSLQAFLTLDAQGKHIQVSLEDIEQCRPFIAKFASIFFHASYVSNLADNERHYHGMLHKEMSIANALGVPYMVIHPGVVPHTQDKSAGIKAVIRTVNQLLKNHQGMTVVLENMPYGKRAIGGDLQDFLPIIDGIEDQDRLRFCIDTAHAYAFGYDIADCMQHDDFLELIDRTVGISRVALLHVNDSVEPLGKERDQHAMPGIGYIGKEALKALVQHQALRHVPIIVEAPISNAHEYQQIMEQIQDW